MNPNFVFADWESENGIKKTNLTKITMLPILPSISYTYKF